MGFTSMAAAVLGTVIERAVRSYRYQAVLGAARACSDYVAGAQLLRYCTACLG